MYILNFDSKSNAYNKIKLHLTEIILLERKLQIMECQIRKVIQLHETMIVRWGVMLVGPTGGGKTVVLHVSLLLLITLNSSRTNYDFTFIEHDFNRLRKRCVLSQKFCTG